MMKHVELDPTFRLDQQYSDTSNATTILINIFDVDPADAPYFRQAWLTDAKFFLAQPGAISAQLHQGIEGSRIFMNYAVFENTKAFAATNDQPEFGPLRAVYPDSATAHPHLFRRVAVPGICVGEVAAPTGLTATAQEHGLQPGELDPTCPVKRQYDDTSGKTTILVNLIDVDPADHAYFTAAWQANAEVLRTQPGCLSSQLHQGIGDSRLFLGYAVFENAAAVAAAGGQPELGALRQVYPDSATAHPHLMRRLAISDVCVGEG